MRVNQSAVPTLNLNPTVLCQQYLNVLYQNVYGHGVNARQRENIAEAYGEILYGGIDTLLSHLSLSDQDVFFDLGSGLGKAVIQVFLTTPVKAACGIEIIPELYQKSVSVARQIQHDLPELYSNARSMTFLQGSFFDIPLSGATAILIGSPCFSQKMLYELGKIIDATPSIHTVLTLRPLSSLKRLSFQKIVRVECSWDTALCYVYRPCL